MGQKVNPHGLRVGVIKDWDSKWYAEGDFSDLLVEDYNIRKFLKKKLYNAGISKVEVERASERVKVTVYAAKPGVIIGKGGQEIEKTKAELQKLTGKKIFLLILPVQRPTAREPSRCRHCALISIMVLLRPIPLMVRSVSRFGSTKVRFFLQRIPMRLRPDVRRYVHYVNA